MAEIHNGGKSCDFFQKKGKILNFLGYYQLFV